MASVFRIVGSTTLFDLVVVVVVVVFFFNAGAAASILDSFQTGTKSLAAFSIARLRSDKWLSVFALAIFALAIFAFSPLGIFDEIVTFLIFLSSLSSAAVLIFPSGSP